MITIKCNGPITQSMKQIKTAIRDNIRVVVLHEVSNNTRRFIERTYSHCITIL